MGNEDNFQKIDINFKNEDAGREYLNKLLCRYENDKIKFKKV